MAEKELISESRRAAEMRATRAAAEFKHITEKLVSTEQRNNHLERLSQSQKTLIMDSNGIVEVGKHAMTVARQAEGAAAAAKEEAERARLALSASRGETDMWSRRAKSAEGEANGIHKQLMETSRNRYNDEKHRSELHRSTRLTARHTTRHTRHTTGEDMGEDVGEDMRGVRWERDDVRRSHNDLIGRLHESKVASQLTNQLHSQGHSQAEAEARVQAHQVENQRMKARADRLEYSVRTERALRQEEKDRLDNTTTAFNTARVALSATQVR